MKSDALENKRIKEKMGSAAVAAQSKQLRHLIRKEKMMKKCYVALLCLFVLLSFSTVAFADDHGDGLDSATPVGNNSTTTGSIETGGDYDFFFVVVPCQGTLTVYTQGNTDTYGYLRKSTSFTMHEDDNSGQGNNFSISVYEGSAGNYFIAVRHYSPSGTGDYQLRVEFDGACADSGDNCISLPAWDSYGNKVPDGESHPNQVDFCFDGVTGDVGISYEAYDVDVDTELEILINGHSVGYASKTPNNAWGDRQMVTLPDAYVNNDATNILTFNCTGNPPKSWKWGVKEVRYNIGSCADSCGGQSPDGCWCDDECQYWGDCCPDKSICDAPGIPLPAPGSYGNRVPGGESYPDQMDFSFDGVSGDVGISYEAYDVDIDTEIEILINGQPVGYAPKTPNNAWGGQEIVTLPDTYVNDDAINIMTFNCTGNPPKTWKWGVREVDFYIDSSFLAGTWALTNVNGGTFTVTLQPEGYSLRLSHSGVNIVWEGLYEIQGDYLVMTEPDNPSFNGFSWQIVNVDYLYLTNTDYAGSTMIR